MRSLYRIESINWITVPFQNGDAPLASSHLNKEPINGRWNLHIPIVELILLRKYKKSNFHSEYLRCKFTSVKDPLLLFSSYQQNLRNSNLWMSRASPCSLSRGQPLLLLLLCRGVNLRRSGFGRINQITWLSGDLSPTRRFPLRRQ